LSTRETVRRDTPANPEILPVTEDGRRLAFGARQSYCPSSASFRAAAVDLAGRMASRYGSHPAVAMWHIGNEYGCHVPACYCEQSAAAFRRWLEARYREIERLNEACRGAVWSQDYTGWDQIEPPRTARRWTATPTRPTPRRTWPPPWPTT
jgi:beta-galactosidase